MKRWTVRDVMTRDVVTLGPEAGYKQIVERMLDRAVSAIPVVDADGHVLGVVSELDLMHKLEFAGIGPHVSIFERKAQKRARIKAGADTAQALMSSPAIVIFESDGIVTAAALMHEKGIKRLPVVGPGGQLVGIVSRGDLLRAYLRSDKELGEEIAKEVLRRAMWLEPYEIEVKVVRGVVTLTGRVDRHSTAEITVHLVHAVPGVVDVVDELTYRQDDSAEFKRLYWRRPAQRRLTVTKR